MKKLVIFDFDGVIIDSFDAWYKINAYAFKKSLGKKFTKGHYRNCYMDELNVGFRSFAGSEKNYQKFQIFKSVHKKELFLKYFSKVKLFPLIKSLIYKLKEFNIKLVIVTSSTNPAGVSSLLKKFKLDKKFAVVSSSQGENKVSHLKRILAKFKRKPKDAYFISDTYNDIKWGRKVGLKTIAVLWGFHNKQILARVNPDFIVKDYKDVVKIIKNSL